MIRHEKNPVVAHWAGGHRLDGAALVHVHCSRFQQPCQLPLALSTPALGVPQHLADLARQAMVKAAAAAVRCQDCKGAGDWRGSDFWARRKLAHQRVAWELGVRP